MSEKRKLVIGIAAFFLVILASLLLYQYVFRSLFGTIFKFNAEISRNKRRGIIIY